LLFSWFWKKVCLYHLSLITCGKHGSYAVSVENRCKIIPLYTSSFEYEWVKSPFLKNNRTYRNYIQSFKFFSRMETWPTHIQNSISNSHFTPIFLQNCVWAIFNILTDIINQIIINLDIRIWYDHRLLIFFTTEPIWILKIYISCVSGRGIWLAL
jgi:hypothetical protein